MKIYAGLVLLLFVLISNVNAQSKGNKALVLIDIQDFYFPGGATELVGAEKAADTASEVLKIFRKNDDLILHVKHRVKAGGEINQAVKAIKGEKVIEKSEVNAFKGTPLKEYLEQNKVNELVLIGMQTHMCLEAAARAAADYGYKVTVISDACATRDLNFNDKFISAEQVHYSTLSTLKSYCDVITFEEFEKKFLN